MSVSKNEIHGAIEILKVCFECIQAHGPIGMPSGILYAVLMSQGCDLPKYNKILATLTKSGLVEKRGDLLFATR